MQMESIYPTARGLDQSGKRRSSTALDRRYGGGLQKHFWQLASLVFNFSHWLPAVWIFSVSRGRVMFFYIIEPLFLGVDPAAMRLPGRPGGCPALTGRIRVLVGAGAPAS
jgi:hypothetical protein